MRLKWNSSSALPQGLFLLIWRQMNWILPPHMPSIRKEDTFSFPKRQNCKSERRDCWQLNEGLESEERPKVLELRWGSSNNHAPTFSDGTLRKAIKYVGWFMDGMTQGGVWKDKPKAAAEEFMNSDWIKKNKVSIFQKKKNSRVPNSSEKGTVCQPEETWRLGFGERKADFPDNREAPASPLNK